MRFQRAGRARGARAGLGGRARRVRRARAGRLAASPLAAARRGRRGAAVVAAALSPPGRAVVDSLREAVGVEQAEPALFSLPARGRLLVSGRAGLWVVQPDGSKRRLGRYRDAAFSPHGLFVAATRANQLAALDPKGDVRWTLARPAPRFPAWTGTRRTRASPTSRGRPARRRRRRHRRSRYRPRRARRAGLAARAGPRARLLRRARGRRRRRRPRRPLLRPAPILEPVRKLAWSRDGRLLLAFARTRPASTATARSSCRTTPRTRPSTPTPRSSAPGTSGGDPRRRGQQQRLLDLRRSRVFRGTGVFRQLEPSPDGRWLLVSWPTANQWVFVRAGRGRSSGSRGSRSSSDARPPSRDGAACAHRLVVVLVAAVLSAAAPARVVIGHSVRGRAIVAYERGDPPRPRRSSSV